MARRLLLTISVVTLMCLSGSLIGAQDVKTTAEAESASSAATGHQHSTSVGSSEPDSLITTLAPEITEKNFQCYQCNSHYNNQSACAKTKEELPKDFLQDCPLNSKGEAATGCWKLYFEVPFDMNGVKGPTDRTVRSCAYSTTANEEKGCAHQSEFGSKSNQCFCKKSACNQSSPIDNASLISILFSLTISFGLSMLYH